MKSELMLNDDLLNTKTMFNDKEVYMNPVKMIKLYDP